MKRDIAQEVTDKVISMLESGVIPWNKPWNGDGCMAVKYRDGEPYSLINQMLLPKGGEWIGFDECKKRGGHVKKGEHGSMVVFYDPHAVTSKDENGEPLVDENGNPMKRTVHVLQAKTVFHVATQCEGIEPKVQMPEPNSGADRISEAETVLADYIKRSGVTLDSDLRDSATYSESDDTIRLPMLEQFADSTEYYSTAFHEATHSTGAAKRLNRNIKNRFGSKEYSREELVAEMGAATMLTTLGLETKKALKNSTAYIQSWLKNLRNDKNLVVYAAAKAGKAVDLILGKETKTEE